jgi:penicillin G amidase
MRWFKKLALGLLALVTLLACTVAFYVWRSFPTLTGEQKLPGLQGSVRITRDAADVTHIFAQSQWDAALALGYTHAQERSWQLEFNRRVMHGELSELLGPATLETDKLMRSLGIVRAAQKQFDALPPESKKVLEAYTLGINNFHAHSRQALPPEFHILRAKPGTWTPADSMGWGIMMALDLGGNWGLEFARLSAAQKLPTQRLWELFTPYPGEAPASKVDFSKLYAALGVYNTQPVNATKTAAAPAIEKGATGLFGIKNALHDALHLAKASHDAITQPFTHALVPGADVLGAEVGNIEGKGSNNWVVAGSHTTSGKPLLANDPHLGLSAPAIWYFARLHISGAATAEATGATTPELDVIGATLPGLPSVILGRTAKVAWGFTNTGPDVQDLYLEQINPANPAQYKTPTGWAEFEQRTETIKVKGQPEVPYTYRATRHGPVLSDAQAVHAEVLDLKKYVLALRWSALDADNRTILAGLNAQQAQSVDELLAAYADYHSPMQNVVAADVSGKIAYKAIGKVPVRSADNDIKGIAPAPGWEARYDWVGWLPYAQTPQDDGKDGWVATANQRIHARDYPHFMGQDWTSPQRFTRIEQLLGAQPKHDTASMQRIQADTTSIATQNLLPVLRATASSHALAAAAQALLKDFDANMKADSTAPLIFAAWADELARGLITPRLGEAKFKTMYGKRQFRATVEMAMATNNGYWCGPKTCAEQSADALGRALDRLSALYGSDPAQWRWGTAHIARSIHKPLGNAPALAKLFDVTVPTGGDPWTVNVGQYWLNEDQPFHNRHAASLRTVFDLANLENSHFIYQTGQSGLVFSSRYRDMRDQWSAVAYRPLQLQGQGVGKALLLTP